MANEGIFGATARGWTATGGTITNLTLNGIAYRIHTFTSSGTLALLGPTGFMSAEALLNAELLAEYLLVGGGGGSGGGNAGYYGGGGGGGGVRHGLMSLLPGSYSIVIGAGGAGSTLNTSSGFVGSDSTALGLTASGGGYGGAGNQVSTGVGANGGPGGSGGGGGAGSNNNATTNIAAGGAVSVSTTPPQGNTGGGSTTAGGLAATGGGVRASGSSNVAIPPPGNGFCCDISGTWTGYGDGGAQGLIAGPVNTGTGGSAGNTTAGNAGGSGVFILRYRT